MPRIKYQEAAGLTIKRGRPPVGEKPSENTLRNLYIVKKKSIRTIAFELNCSKDMVVRALAEYGIKRRAEKRPSRLDQIPLMDLYEAVDREGYEAAARRFGVGRTTLFLYLKRREGQ
jgi:DNA invertase Pin-like site-specific DNA recombinase